MAKHSSLPSPDMIPRRRAAPPPSPETAMLTPRADSPAPATTPAPVSPPPLPAASPAPSPAPVAAAPAPAPVPPRPAPAPAPEGRVRALQGKVPHRKIGVRLDRERYQRLKRHAADHGLSVEEIAIAALDRYLGPRNGS
jgi:hypothetical protein